MTIKKDIIYPFFLECCKYTDDAFWTEIFDDLAYGKTPNGAYISKNFLCCGYKGKEFNYKIERKDPKILFEEVSTLLTEKMGILSQKEKNKKRIDFHNYEREMSNSRQNWADIRKKYIKDVLYEKYVIKMKNQYNLSMKQCKFLLAVITISIMFKTISVKDIVYEDDEIVHIEGIEFEQGEILLKRPICTSSKMTEPQIVPKTKKVSDLWTKYLKTINL
jgi:hypothetical protein